MAKFQLNELIRPYGSSDTVRLADGPAKADQLTDADVGKFVKLKGDSRYGLCAVGDEIEGFVVTASDAGGASYDGYLLGTIQKTDRKKVTLDGLQATPGVGSIAVNDYVVAGRVTERGTKQIGSPKVCKATAAKKDISFLWRVVSIKGEAPGTPGTAAVIERV